MPHAPKPKPSAEERAPRKKNRAPAPSSTQPNHALAPGSKSRQPRAPAPVEEDTDSDDEDARVPTKMHGASAPSSTRSAGSKLSSSGPHDVYEDEDDSTSRPSKRRRTGPTTHQSDDDQCLHLALYAVRSGGLFLNFDSCLQVGVYRALDTLEGTSLRALSASAKRDYNDMKDHEVDYCDRLWQWISDHCRYFSEVIRAPGRFSELSDRVTWISTKIGIHRSNDIKNTKFYINQIAAHNADVGLDNTVHHNADRALLGFSHKELARLLVPATYLSQYLEDEDTIRLQIKNDSAPFTVRSGLLPSFLYSGKKYCGDKFDPEHPWRGLCDGYALSRFLKMILIRHKAVCEPNASSLINPRSNCMLMETPVVMREHIAYSLVILRFVMSSVPSWPSNDAAYNFARAHRYFLEWMHDDRVKKHVDAMVARVNKKVFGHEEGYKPGQCYDEDASDDEENDFDRLLCRLPTASPSPTLDRAPRLRTADLQVELGDDTTLDDLADWRTDRPDDTEPISTTGKSSSTRKNSSRPPSTRSDSSDEDEDEDEPGSAVKAPTIAPHPPPSTRSQPKRTKGPVDSQPAAISSSKNSAEDGGVDSELSSIEEDEPPPLSLSPPPVPPPSPLPPPIEPPAKIVQTRSRAPRITTGRKSPRKHGN
ncbi:hypothetical protein CONPUDRAFT_150503 [Coniophora puteana RWD-64-598 SS2]|uniref:Uncharacterized protein n=1 Tax=Coniophora puteana (strain RWD-64-598) TaxID=741705 RepID=A0A5M3N2U5_CONPW|nr:uncharacterized protein CONPUDRAFT_150503 [Coniophora puteana RWD-64-598 SS2]EIW85712.1 hypothetical protein CONPUDRAFT_150503 [Coniophora puteana RWD-64-598 SS2]